MLVDLFDILNNLEHKSRGDAWDLPLTRVECLAQAFEHDARRLVVWYAGLQLQRGVNLTGSNQTCLAQSGISQRQLRATHTCNSWHDHIVQHAVLVVVE